MKPQDSLDEVFQLADDFNLCNIISDVIEERYGYDPVMMWSDSIPYAQRLVEYTWSTTGFLECEGFARFFNLECNHSAYPECFDVLGLSSLASTIRESLKLFPKSDLGDTDALISHFGSWEQIEKIVDDAESELYSKSKEIEIALANYIRNHKSEFESLLPEIQTNHGYKKLIDKKIA